MKKDVFEKAGADLKGWGAGQKKGGVFEGVDTLMQTMIYFSLFIQLFTNM